MRGANWPPRHAGITPVPADPEALADYFTFTDFAHFIEVYLSVVDLIRDAEDVWTLTHQVGADLAAQHVRYAELTVTPYSSVVRGIAAEAFCEALEDARRSGRAGPRHHAALVLRHPRRGRSRGRRRDPRRRPALPPGRAGQLRPRRSRDRGAAPAVRAALRAARRPAGLHSRAARGGVRPGRSRSGTRSTPSARSASGTASPPRRIRPCCKHLVDRGIALEVCPTSNVCTRSVPSLAEHPLPALVAAGVMVTINSDDPPMFATTLNDEYVVAASLLGPGRDRRRRPRPDRCPGRRSCPPTARRR